MFSKRKHTMSFSHIVYTVQAKLVHKKLYDLYIHEYMIQKKRTNKQITLTKQKIHLTKTNKKYTNKNKN